MKMDNQMITELNAEELAGISGGAAGSQTRLSPKPGCIVYKIKSGETLSHIANTYRTTVQLIMSENSGIISNPNYVRAGYYIYVPV